MARLLTLRCILGRGALSRKQARAAQGHHGPDVDRGRRALSLFAQKGARHPRAGRAVLPHDDGARGLEFFASARKDVPVSGPATIFC